MIGQLLNHRYKIISLLGEGGMGEVYLASDEKSHQRVAVKILARQLTANPESLKRFKREGETLRQLDHPNIVKFIDTFEYENQYVIVMEYVAGGSLYDLLKKGPLSIERAHRITLELCDALIRSHHVNIIHRDIKPENVLLTENGNPKLADFGVARLSEGGRMTRTGTQVGTPYYMAPEAWEGKALDAQADIWSLGIMLFEMLAGHVPFSGDTPIAVMSKVHNSSLPNLKKLRPDTPTNLININKRMLARDKKRRYQIMREVGVDLEKSLQTPLRPLQSVTSNVAKSITGIQSKVSSLVKARSKPISKTHITDENKVKSKPSIKFSFKPTRVFGLIALVLILLTSSIFLAPQLSTLLPAWTTASPIQADSTLTETQTLTTTQAITVTSTPDPRINARIAEVCGENVCIYDGLNEIFDTISNPSSFVINSSPPSWSPDGTQLVLAEREGKGEEFPTSIYVLNIQTKEFTELTVSSPNSAFPSWSPDGKYIAYHETCHVRIISPDGTIKKELLHNRFNRECANTLRWSPDSKIIAWVAYDNTEQRLVGFGIIDVASKNSAFMEYEFASDQQLEMAWSPDGSRLNLYYPEVGYSAFFSVRAGCTESECSIDDRQIENGAYPPDSWLPNYYPQWDGENESSVTNLSTSTPSITLGIGSTKVSSVDSMTMVYVPEGEFIMGSEDGNDDEKPVHTLALDAFWIDQTEITNIMYAKCVADNVCKEPANVSSQSRTDYYSNPSFGDYPVIYVDWDMANQYCSWAERRLPTEAEWEKAARGTDGGTYPWGEEISCDLTNYNHFGCYGDTSTVGSFEGGKSIYEVYDMAGNVAEWVTSLYKPYPYDANDGREILTGSSDVRVLRGGSWRNIEFNIRSAFRSALNPSTSLNTIGFRCAQSGENESSVTSLPTSTPSSSLGVGSSQVSAIDGMTMVYVPEGEFILGLDPPNDEPYFDNSPQLSVTLDAFWIDQTEVTNKQFTLCVSAGNCNLPLLTASPTRSNYFGDPEFDNYPVIYIEWEQAKNYCEWAGRRLPTEEEWEKTARGPDGNIYPWGNDVPNDNLLNFNSNIRDTTKVGNYESGKSFYGAYDMAGNVWEWVNSLYLPYQYNSGDEIAGGYSSEVVILRGGSWYFEEGSLRSIFRFGVIPVEDLVRSDTRSWSNPIFENISQFGKPPHGFGTVGFRCALSATP